MTYQPEKVFSQKDGRLSELVLCQESQQHFVRHVYLDDKRELFATLQSIENPHIPKILEVNFTDKTIVIEEYIEGKPLDEVLLTETPAKKQVAGWVRSLVGAVNCLHEHNVLHRDIKPENVLVSNDGGLWLIDFDIARIYRGTATHDTTLLGTEGYAAPEQYGFSQSDFRTDIYALGVTIERMTKTAGFSKNSFLNRMTKKCTQFDPARRFQSTAQMARQLKYGKLKPAFLGFLLALSCFLVVVVVGLQPAEVETNTSGSIPVSQALAAPGTMSPINQPNSMPPVASIRGVAEIIEGDWVTQWQNDRIFESYYTNESLFMPSLLLRNGAGRSGQAKLLPEGPTITISATLEEEWLLLELSDGGIHTRSLALKNAVTNTNPAFPSGTAIEAEVLVFDMNNDGVCEILPALTDCKRISLLNGQVTTNTNWRAAWCISYTPENGFTLAEGQAYCVYGTMEVGTYVIPEGIWLNQMLEFYLLEDGKIVYYKAN